MRGHFTWRYLFQRLLTFQTSFLVEEELSFTALNSGERPNYTELTIADNEIDSKEECKGEMFPVENINRLEKTCGVVHNETSAHMHRAKLEK